MTKITIFDKNKSGEHIRSEELISLNRLRE